MNRLDKQNTKVFDLIERVLNFYNSRLWLRVLVHLTYIYLMYVNLHTEFMLDDPKLSIDFYLYLTTNILAVYFIFYYAFPKYFAKQKYLIFFLIVALWYFTAFTYFTFLQVQAIYALNKITAYSETTIGDPFLVFIATFKKWGLLGHFRSISSVFVVFFQFRDQFGLIIMLKSMKYFVESTVKQKHLNDLNYTLESKYLQSQLNPHFLFNSLNNIYGLILNQKPETEKAIGQLQSLLKQSFNDASGNNVPLQVEVDYLKNYINLEKIRHDQNVTIDFEVDETSLQGHSIAPRVLLPFVENAFKHGLANNIDQARINISLTLQGKKLTFRITNTKPILKIKKATVGGIGLVNIKRRLTLLYPNHSLHIQDNPQQYEVNLSLYL